MQPTARALPCTHVLDGGEHVGALGVGLRRVAAGRDGVGKLGRRAGGATCRHSIWPHIMPPPDAASCHTAR